MGFRRDLRGLCILACRAAFGVLLGAALAAAPAPQARRTVVILHSISPEMPGLRELTNGILTSLEKGSAVPVDCYNEYTGLDRFEGATYETSLLSLYNEKYGSRKVDLLIPVGAVALDFAVRHKLLAQVPIVTCYIAERFVKAARERRPETTGALPALNAPLTIDLMLTLFPQTRHIEVVLGASPYERNQSEAGRKISFAKFAGRVQFDYLNDLTMEQMEARLGALQEDSLVVFASVLRDAAGRDFTSNFALNRLSKASARPVFGLVEEDVGDGIVGGILLTMGRSGTAAGELGLRVLNGERASALPFAQGTGSVPMFDARELARWDIREHSLPKDSVIKFRTPGLWDTYWKEVLGALAVILAEAVLVAGLVIQLRLRRRAQADLARAETRYRTVADFTHDWEFWRRADGGLEYVSPACERVSGYPPAAFKEDAGLLERIVLEDDLPAWKAAQAEALAGREQASLEYRICTAAGALRWVEQSNNPVRLDGARLAGSRGSIRDITARKAAELDLLKAYEEIAALKDRLEAENTYYREQVQAEESSNNLLGNSNTMKYLQFRMRQVAPSETTVLIQGETGTGKELVAEAIHTMGPRAQRPLIKINCASLPSALAESELFGHEKGSFTGAQSQRKGRFELADGATLFLDEIGELSPEVQAKLLRVLQDGEFQRVGGDRTLKVDVRVIAATNRDLAQEVAAGRFREDLWYRLNVFPITVPPLRNRKDDIPELTQAFVTRFCAKLGRPVLDLPKSLLQTLDGYDWPGNVRELQNIVERAVLVSQGSTLQLAEPPQKTARPTMAADGIRSLEAMERAHIIQTLEATHWKVEGPQGAAAILDLRPSTLRNRMLKLDIRRSPGA